MNVKILTDVSVEPITLSEFKLFAKIGYSTDDTLIAIILKAAREICEKYTNLSLAEKELSVYFEVDEDEVEFQLPYSPINSVSKVYLVDGNGGETELTLNSTYFLSGQDIKKITISQTFTLSGSTNVGLRVEYIAGYTDENIIPDACKLAIMKEALTQYNYRENMEGNIFELNNASKILLNPFRTKLWL